MKLKRLVLIILVTLVWASPNLVQPVFSHPAEVRDVVPRDVGGVTYLNITIWHDIESSLHYVDTLEVTWSDNVTTLAIDPRPLAPDGTFTVDYIMGPVSGTPAITVRARCTVTGYSGALSWEGQIPEFASLAFLLLFMIGTLIAIFLFKKH
ncbi:MAG: hypothetical protein JSV64_02410 [Candidatus Bathyarchaeota archaeon]|jgi:hypothetical protein|nr:MAG: hypothetical protein JSV64_02410 [Candidatus Bathyarchaeota archaeon]